ncbi:Protein CMSS1 [Ananas comosus]|uniref:Protein CMSS1 n=1 Tax=Ananas comosus TaxID=4615 RepID=A0A199W346_ANACO|nr:Protein CMSS1 [Ananas comosus]
MARERPKTRTRKMTKKTKNPIERSKSKPLSSLDPLMAKTKTKTNKRKKGRIANPNLLPLGENETLVEEPAEGTETKKKKEESGGGDFSLISAAPAEQQLRFFLHWFQSGAKMKLSPLEIEAYNDNCMVELAEGVDQNVDNFSEHVKGAFGTPWKEALCEGKLSEGSVDAGSPALLVISTSALRSLELLRGLKPFTRDCRAVKLFAKHMKVEEQVTSLKGRVNIASGTPSRIKKLIDLEAMSLSRLQVVVLDMQRDAKSFSLFTLPQVSTEFWDLYRSHLEPKVLCGDTRICFYGAVRKKDVNKALASAE